MITHPKPGLRVQLRYSNGVAGGKSRHGKTGTMLFRTGGRHAGSHLVLLDDGTTVTRPVSSMFRIERPALAG